MDEYRDVVIIGARLAGASAASHLARAGADVVVLDRSAFPSDQMSTHLLFPDGLNEVRKMGALDGILAHNPTKSPWLKIMVGSGTSDAFTILERWRQAGPIDYCLCVPRLLQDVELVKAARDSGADVRERHKLVEVLWHRGRAIGVRYADAEGNQGNIYARLVVGADGRRSSVASQVGAFEPYRASKNGRALVWRYADDPRFGTRDGESIHQWRDGDSLAFLFPSAPAPKMLVLFMGAAAEAAEALSDPEGYWERKLADHPGVAERLEGATNFTQIRATGDTTSYFRASSGLGWALIGDAGHFKDPVIGQGQRDALWSGRRLAELVAESLHDPMQLDHALREWETERDAECLHAYHFGNIETTVEPTSPALLNVLRRHSRTADPAPDAGDLFGRGRTMPQVLSLPRLGLGVLDAIRSRHRDLAAPGAGQRLVRDIRLQLAVRAELRAKRFRSSELVTGSDHPQPEPPKPVRAVPRVETAHRADTNLEPATGPVPDKQVPEPSNGSVPSSEIRELVQVLPDPKPLKKSKALQAGA